MVDSGNMFSEGKEKKVEEDKPVVRDRDGWMDTLSDLIFLMITFFVLLITMSSMNTKSLKEAFGLFDEASGVMKFPDPQDGEESFVQVMTPLGEIRNDSEKVDGKIVELNVAQEDARRFIKGVRDGLMNEEERDELYSTLKPMAEKLVGDVQILRVEGGVEVVLSGRLLFPHGSETLTEEGHKLLQDVAVILLLWGGDVKIVAMWPWFQAPEILTEIVSELESRRIPGKRMKPEMFDSLQRKIRFVLRKGEDDGK
ncbi:MAG: hypothetical protein JXX29_15370 [Deltaproteobacteria bacterium]|nr:hypothetical protein [Deltaproteobacteria bacterium]